jgi:tRNA A-37 threonylcarbamoyl transferase component Bud32
MPTTLHDRYQLDELIGSGAAGTVYRARDLRLGRRVAVKRLRSDAFGGDEARARFEREAFALARVSHPHVLPVFDVSTDDDEAYFVTAFCADGTLADRIRTRPLTCPEVRDLVHDVAAGLVAMHQAGIVHRDNKPSNILRLDGRWVIGDFGIARVEGDSALTQTGAVIGTPDYWAPETARGATPTAAVEVYGLGCVAFEALAGRPPFRGATPLETGLLHATAAPPALPGGVRRKDPALAALVARMLDKEPGARPRPVELADVPSAPADSSDTLVYPDPATVAITQPALPPTVAYPGVPRRGHRRASRRVIFVCGVLAIAAALVLAAAIRGENSGGPARVASPRATPDPVQATPVPSTVSGSTLSVPRLVGRTVASATAVLAQHDLALAVAGTVTSTAPRGSITAQEPPATRRVDSGATIHVTVSAGPPATTPVSAGAPPPDIGKPGKAKTHGHGRGKHGHGKK